MTPPAHDVASTDAAPPAGEPGSPQETRLAVLVATAVWIAVLVATLVLGDDLRAQGRDWWVWTALAGSVIGLLGLLFLRAKDTRDI